MSSRLFLDDDVRHTIAVSEEWLTVKQVAQALSVSQRQVWGWIGCSMFAVKKCGPRLVRISRRSLQACIDHCEHPCEGS